MVAYLGIAAAMGWAIRKYSTREAVRNPLAFGAYVAWSLVSSLFITPLALCTMDSRDWGTRTKAPEAAAELEPEPEAATGTETEAFYGEHSHQEN
jgi:hypothetical protein